MTPGARQQAAIELLAEIFGNPKRPADAVASDWLRARRYIGGSDRRAILNRVWGVLRARAQLAWWLARGGYGTAVQAGDAQRPAPADDPRALVIADALLRDAWPMGPLKEAFDGGPHRPNYLSREEERMAGKLAGQKLEHPEQPPAVRLNIPDWIEPGLRAAFASADEAVFEREIAALGNTPPVDLRVNPLRGTRDEAVAALARQEVKAEPGALSPHALRLKARTSVVAGAAFRAGLVEVQDEGSQIVALLLGARPGMQVLDWCAGAGGKTLAIAAGMHNKGRVVACDTSAGRLERSATRLRRAGVHNVERRVLDAEGRKWAKRNQKKFDRVLVDAPCSGTGTWRRNPDGRWTLAPHDVAELQPKQAEILDAAARMTAPGGRLVYATCSLLPEENERQAEAFLQRHPDFVASDVGAVWRAELGGEMPGDARSGPWLRLTPARHGTDGFFAAIFERKGKAKANCEDNSSG